MALAAAQVVDALAARITGLPLAGARVFTSRAWPIGEGELPAWRVTAADEDITPLTVGAPLIQTHDLQVELRGYSREVDDLDDKLHELTAEAATAIAAAGADDLAMLSPRLAIALRRVERTLGAEGEAAVGVATLTYVVRFNTAANDPQTILL